jgi:hypothetical protein
MPAELLQVRDAAPGFGRGANHFFDHERARDATPSRRIGRGLDRDVIIRNDRGATAVEHLGRHLEIHNVALVVLDDEQCSLALIDALDCSEHLVRRRSRENLAGTGGVQHAEADEAGMQRLMSRTAARDQRDLAGGQRLSADKFARRTERDDVRVRCGKSSRLSSSSVRGELRNFFMGSVL